MRLEAICDCCSDDEDVLFEIEIDHSVFPDGQRHLKLVFPEGESFEGCWVRAYATVRSADDLFDLALLDDILTHNNIQHELRVEYLLGARMDRRIDDLQPRTSAVVGWILGSQLWDNVEVLDIHSKEAMEHIALESISPVKNTLPQEWIDLILYSYIPEETVIIIPDKGAIPRVIALTENHSEYLIVQCLKHRDSKTGKLSGFECTEPEKVIGKVCLILDDICDGGGTFIGLAEVLKEAGATEVDLAVTYGLFSRGKAHLYEGGLREVHAYKDMRYA